MTDILHMNFLGGLNLTLGQEPLSRFISSKAPALLSYLAYTGQPHTRATLTGLLWGESPEVQAKASLRQVLTDLRRSLAPYLLIERETVAFNTHAPHWLDVSEFSRQVQSALPTPGAGDVLLSDAQAAALQSAVDLYRGDFLAGFFVPNAPAFEEWVMAEQAWLRQTALQALHQLVAHYTARKAYLLGINAATRLLALEPWQEEAHRDLMLLLAYHGQRSAALAQYETCRRVLARDLGVEPTPATLAIFEQIRSGEISPAHTPKISLPASAPTPHNLPAQSSTFVGRQAESGQLVTALTNPAGRIATITGVSGVGKTRLALAVAQEIRADYPQGVWVVPLSDTFNASTEVAAAGATWHGDGVAEQLLANEIAAALNLAFSCPAEPTQQLIETLRPKKLLLLLDGLKNAPAAAIQLLRKLLSQAPDVALLITAQQPLGLPQEHALALAGLPVPAHADDTDAAAYDSVRLFTLRADNRATGGFRPVPAELPTLVEICQLLDGHPLGIELAAAWAERLSAAEILHTLRHYRVRKPPRQVEDSETPNLPDRAEDSGVPNLFGRVAEQNRLDDPRIAIPAGVSAALEGSWMLLSAPEQAHLTQLTLFRDDFDTQAAGAITGASPEILTGLVERLLLQAPDPNRYLVHRLLHTFIADKVAVAPRLQLAQGTDAARITAPSDLTHDRHCIYYLNFLTQREAPMQNRQMPKAVAEIQREWRHIQQAWYWAITHGPMDRLQRSVNALSRYLYLRGLCQVGEKMFGAAAAALRVNATTDPLQRLINALARGQLLLGQARFLNLQSDHARSSLIAQAAQAQFEQTLAQARAEEIPGLAVASLSNLGSISLLQDNYTAAATYLEQALQIYQTVGDPLHEADTLSDLGVVMMLHGDYAAAHSYLARSLQTARRANSRTGEGLASYNLGQVADITGDYAAARGYFEHALRIGHDISDDRLEAQALASLGLLLHHLGEQDAAWETSDRAVRLAQLSGNNAVEAEASTNSGHALLSLGMHAEAATAYEQALVSQQALGQDNMAMEPLAGLAQVALAQGRIGKATAYVEEILRHLAPDESPDILALTGLKGTREPFRVCLTCAQVLQASRSSRAGACLTTIYHLLQARANRISDAAMRAAFLEQVAIHRDIAEALRSGGGGSL